MIPDRALAYARSNRSRFISELMEYARFPTISAQPRHASDLARCAAWLADHLRSIGLDQVVIVPTRRHPIVYAQWAQLADRPTVLIYGHYDVQPADPLHEWLSPPFDPEVRGNDLYGRGTCDDKGQMLIHVKALESYLQTERALPLNVKCLFEGEEEIGSPNLPPFVSRNKRALAADAAIMSDTRMLAPDRPAINYAERGMLALELEVIGPRQDLHSGNFGGAVHNPLQVLCEVIGTLHGAGRRVEIPGFYDRVRSWSQEERAYMARAGPSDADIMRDAQAQRGWGECGYTLYERTTIRPALTVNGITGGYQGPGVKGVIPARASAKISFRLVPDQDPHEIDRLFRRHISRIAPPTVTVQVRTLSSAKPALVNRRHPAVRAAALAYRNGFGAEPVYLRSGGTIPIVNTFQKIFGIPTVLMGFALPDDRMHAPNEKFHLPNFDHGIATSIWFLAEAATTLKWGWVAPRTGEAGHERHITA
jgi:acetylornithine deacetylase/succinyl-diaminopimelate desuccinylase-like protein